LSQDIIAGCIRKDRKAQELLYKNYYGAMINLCLCYTKNEQDAVEVLNNGFLKVFINIHRYESGKSNLYTWIRTIVINSCLDFLKLKARAVVHGELINAEDHHIDPEAISNMKLTELLQFVRQLPATTRAVFNLYVIEGYSHKEVAALLGISDGTSKWHLSEARKNLKQMIRLQEAKI
jgi:RNA polymerase sigma factor (sigma-70 family)